MAKQIGICMLSFLNNNFGIYNKCEIIEIFGLCNKQPFNIYTLVIFEQTQQQEEVKCLMKSLQRFKQSKEYSWGIKKHIVNIDDTKIFFENLLRGKFKLDKEKESKIGAMQYLPYQYVRPNCGGSNGIVQMNYGLKNNFHSGSYVFEFFDEGKGNCRFLLDNPKLLLEFSEQVNKIIPINIANISDRLGNVIFQLPINNIRVCIDSIKEQNQFKGLMATIYTQNNRFDIKNLIIRVYKDNDNVIQQSLVYVEHEKNTISLNDCYGTIIVEIYDKINGYIVCKKIINIAMQMTLNIHLQEQQRIFSIYNDIQRIDIEIQAGKNTCGEPKNKPYTEWIIERKYEKELKELEQLKYFVQYIKTSNPKALEDIRFLINKYGTNGVYLWDPYLNAQDIKNTLYHCKYAYVEVKAISGLKQSNNKTDEMERMREEFNRDDKKLLFLNLEVRARYGNNGGYDFHDRFILFPLEKPKVWSLGISINQFGESHHILQEVRHAQHILNAFNELWKCLNNKECLVWKSK